MYGIGYSHTNASFITDPGPDSWGMYVAADGDARIWLGASSGATSYFNAGNVGIGTTTPSSLLEVYGSSKNIEISNTSETEAGIIFNDAQATTTQLAKIMYNSSNANLNIYNNNHKAVWISGTELFVQSQNANRYIRFTNTIAGQGGSNGGPAIVPEDPNWGVVGAGNYYFWRMYTNSIYRNNELTFSDQRVKNNIRPVSESLTKILQLNPVQYDINTDKHPFYSDPQPGDLKRAKDNLGFIAQELNEVLPELVEYDENYDLFLIKNYDQLFPIVIQAMQEQQLLIDKQESRISELEENEKMRENKMNRILHEIEIMKKTQNK